MKWLTTLFVAVFVAATLFATTFSKSETPLNDGDIVFQTSKGDFGKAIQLATNSPYSHVGIVFIEAGVPMVYEAVQPVRKVPFDEWITYGQKNHYVVKRLAGADTVLNANVIHKMKKLGSSWLGKDYDSQFHWSNERMYCSELVWKLYDENCDLQIGELKPLKAYNLESDLVQQRLEMHYGKNIPWDRAMITPQAMLESELLVTINPEAQKTVHKTAKSKP